MLLLVALEIHSVSYPALINSLDNLRIGNHLVLLGRAIVSEHLAMVGAY